MKAKDLREKSTEELKAQLQQVKKDLLGFYLKGASGEKVDPSQKRNARRDIGRIHTVLREREVRGEVEGRIAALEGAAKSAVGGSRAQRVAGELREARRLRAAILREDPGTDRDK